MVTRKAERLGDITTNFFRKLFNNQQIEQRNAYRYMGLDVLASLQKHTGRPEQVAHLHDRCEPYSSCARAETSKPCTDARPHLGSRKVASNSQTLKLAGHKRRYEGHKRRQTTMILVILTDKRHAYGLSRERYLGCD